MPRIVDGYLQEHGFTKNPRPISKEYLYIRNEAMKAVLSGRDMAKGQQGRLYAMKKKAAEALRGAELVQKVYEHAKLEPVFLQAEDAAEATAGQEQVLARIQNAMGDLENVRRTLRVRKPTARGTEYAAVRAAGKGAGSGTTA